MTNRQNDAQKTNTEFGYYSKLLNEPFDTIDELRKAEEAYNAKQKAKADVAAKKKADATKVEDAFKALNAARKTYKEKLTQLTKEYVESVDNITKAFEFGKKDIHNQLAEAEEAYQAALKEFDTAYPEGYHVTLHDGDFETTLSKHTSGNVPVDIFDLFFGW